ncbi:multicopper oxidase [Virgibacillus soli]|nr:multicopper oxidase [Virgibacillus soli]
MKKFKISISLIGIAFFLILTGCSFNQAPNQPDRSSSLPDAEEKKALPVPPLLEDQNPADDVAEFYLKAQKSRKAFFSGVKTETYGYNGDYLGPVIKVKKGDQVKVHIENGLGNEDTTVHWHGLEVPGNADGGPHSVIKPNETFTPSFTITQPAATLWYHPHLLHKTGEQVYKGLAGLFYIEDEVSDSLNIPKTYGENDFPIIIQDRNLRKDGQLTYDLNMMSVMHGMQGDTPLVNGAFDPYLEVPKGKVRLRILNGSNARIFQLKLSHNDDFWQIASDGGFLEKPLKMTQVVLGPAERTEIIIDFSSYQRGEKIQLLSQDVGLMNFVVGNKPKENVEIPNTLAAIEKINPSKATVNRTFAFKGMGKSVNINGKQMDMNRIDEKVQPGATEIWEITNTDSGMMGGMGMAHPFHAHGVQFQVIERNGKEPPENERGWKDTILLMPGDKVKIIATFKNEGLFMYHCHILEHEDAGMMGQFEVN